MSREGCPGCIPEVVKTGLPGAGHWCDRGRVRAPSSAELTGPRGVRGFRAAALPSPRHPSGPREQGSREARTAVASGAPGPWTFWRWTSSAHCGGRYHRAPGGPQIWKGPTGSSHPGGSYRWTAARAEPAPGPTLVPREMQPNPGAWPRQPRFHQRTCVPVRDTYSSPAMRLNPRSAASSAAAYRSAELSTDMAVSTSARSALRSGVV